MKRLSLGVKLIIFFLLVGLIPFVTSSIIALVKTSNALSDAAYGQLKGMRAVKKRRSRNFLMNVRGI